jgi:hypothetical protein
MELNRETNAGDAAFVVAALSAEAGMLRVGREKAELDLRSRVAREAEGFAR